MYILHNYTHNYTNKYPNTSKYPIGHTYYYTKGKAHTQIQVNNNAQYPTHTHANTIHN